MAVADAFSTLGNSVLTGSVTANDTLNGATVTAFQNPSTSGGSVAVTAAGQLTYTPPTNVSNVNDTFTYTLTKSAGSSSATVTVAIGTRGLFVKNDVAVTGTGSQASPFKTLAEAVTAAGINPAQIVVFQGDGTATGLNTATALNNNQAIAAFDNNQPTISSVITAANNSTLSGLKLTGNVQSTSRNGLTVQNCPTCHNRVRPLGSLNYSSYSNAGAAQWASRMVSTGRKGVPYAQEWCFSIC